MDSKTLVRYMMKTAKNDFCGGKGRIFLPDFLKELPADPKPTPYDLINAWRKHYPKIQIQWVTNNVIIILLGRFYHEIEPKMELVQEEERVYPE